jgi:hypothetical protein
MTRQAVVAGFLGTALIAVAATAALRAARPLPPAREVTWGATFSQKASSRLGLDWRANYLAVVHDLRPGGLRLVAYWDLVEPAEGRYDFRDLDWQMAEARKAGIPVILAVGEKVPRWPEYHFPKWLRANDARERQSKLLAYLVRVVERYRGSPTLVYWQVENEPFVSFGVGPAPDAAFLAKEVAVVRAADPRHRILATDGGEWGTWYRTGGYGDALGITLYRSVYDRRVGTFALPLTPEFYELKQGMTQLIRGGRHERVICAELQAEPWGGKPLAGMTVREQEALFPEKAFAETVAFARRTRMTTFYFWGAEWWYYAKLHGHPGYWRQAKDVMRSGK